MKTIFFTIAILFSITTISAQEVANQEANVITVNVKTSKTDFYKALVKINNFDVTVKETKKEVTTSNLTKTDFYNSLLEKNGFSRDIKKTTRLANVLNKKQETKINQEDNTMVSLLP